MLYALLVAALVAADQIVKYLVRTHIPLGTSVPFLPGLVELHCAGRSHRQPHRPGPVRLGH